jgi:hypothetical protein
MDSLIASLGDAEDFHESRLALSALLPQLGGARPPALGLALLRGAARSGCVSFFQQLFTFCGAQQPPVWLDFLGAADPSAKKPWQLALARPNGRALAELLHAHALCAASREFLWPAVLQLLECDLAPHTVNITPAGAPSGCCTSWRTALTPPRRTHS